TTESIENGPYTRFGVEQFVCDSFIVLGLEEIKGTLRRTILIRKMRFTKHDTAKHPFIIGTRGVEIGASEKVI
ncbi:MAG: ATPase domain-containing protein, partial [Thermoplasmata archaeon]